MSLYIHPENLKMIYKAISSFPLFEKLLLNPQAKNEWFQNIVNNFYNNLSNNILKKKDLNDINRDTIAFMIKDLKKKSLVQDIDIVSDNDQPITNFDELFAKQMKERNMLFDSPIIKPSDIIQLDSKQVNFNQNIDISDGYLNDRFNSLDKIIKSLEERIVLLEKNELKPEL
jgi:hypothetical protein